MRKVALALCVAAALLAVVAADNNAYVTVQAQKSFINKGLAHIKDDVLAEVQSMAVPGMNEEHYSFNSFHPSSVTVGSIEAQFVPPNNVQFKFQDVSLAVPHTGFEVRDKVLWHTFSCDGDFWASMTGGALHVTFPLFRGSDGNLQFGNVGTTVDVGSLSVDHSMNGFFCKVGDSIVDTLIMDINGKIADIVKGKVPSMVSSKVNDKLHEFFNKIHLPIHTPPMVMGSQMKLAYDILGTGESMQWINYPGPIVPRGLSVPSRDLMTFMDVSSMNKLAVWKCHNGGLQTGGATPVKTDTIDLFINGAKALCPGCTLNVVIEFPNCDMPPTFSFANGATSLKFDNGTLTIAAKGPDGMVPITTLGLQGTFSMQNYTSSNNPTHFNFDVALLLDHVTIIENHTGKMILPAMIQVLFTKILAPTFNKQFPGVTIPDTSFGTVSNVAIDANNNKWGVGFDVTFN